ncbi:hypothetical protein [Xanthomonas melonis]|uniref:hypothetical protein n=1 Tax=Xanthomonas melonis TaxID=56456 RepID=UPI001E3FF1D8|nr:hypothetical protein [Xanthomonas melonis]MCD0244638.1 hypothetical protein [Xanthomonas melonis]
MIFWINSVASAKICAHADVIDALNNLGEAGYQGRHAVIGPKKFMKELSNQKGLSRASAAYYKWSSGAVTQLGSLAKRKDCIIVDHSSTTPLLIAQQWNVPLRIFSNPDLLGKSEILCENLTDCEALVAFCNIAVKKQAPGCSISFKPVAGGGDTTHTHITSYLKTPSAPFICVIDSDRDYPGGKLGETAKKCLKAYSSSWNNKIKVHASRELENLIPLDAMRSIGPETSDKSSLEEFQFVAESIAMFADLKLGERPCRFHDIPDSHCEKKAIAAALESTAATHAGFKCGEACSQLGCNPIPKLGKNFLVKFVEWVSQPSNARTISDQSKWNSDLIETINQAISFGISFPRRVF